MDEMQAFAAEYGECRSATRNADGGGGATRVRATLILLGATALVGVVLVGASTKAPTAPPVAVPAVAPISATPPPRVIAPASTQIFMATTEPEIQPPVPGPSVPTLPPHGYPPIPPPQGGAPILTPAPSDPCHPTC